MTETKEPLSIEGWANVWLVVAIVAVVIAMGYVKLGDMKLLGQTIAPMQLLGCAVVVAAVVALGLRR